jgi:hypothetical protein
MPSLPILLKKLETLLLQRVEVEHQIVSVKQEIVAANKPAPKRGRKRGTTAETVELVKATVKVLRDAGQPLPRREIAARLGITPSAVVYRLQKAMAAKFVERVSGGRYRVTNVVPAF